ncbi:ethanolamine utilization protein EutJ [Enterococcus mundtii]|uniref:ethanolamine utilization protein EutJ n=1 Tax=Enterococcus mundtii TaxID=53346 RepID=UPI0011593834|nr:ethanolamine utilization protein EutJ [Enterococcus mundtii]
MQGIEKGNELLESFNKIVHSFVPTGHKAADGYKVGVDLGTASIVLVVLDADNQPLFGSFKEAIVIRDGLVVDYQKAVKIVEVLREEAEAALGFALKAASGAIPPGTIGNNKKVVANVIESAGMEIDQLVDEPSAAALTLDIADGAVIDIGGGTTGISVLKNGEVAFVDDEPTGGTHMTLVIAGYHSVDIDDAEKIKRNPKNEAENFTICRPVIQKMATIAKKMLDEHPIEPIFVVGGAAYFSQFEEEMSSVIGKKVLKPVHPQFVTPIGIAMASKVIVE